MTRLDPPAHSLPPAFDARRWWQHSHPPEQQPGESHHPHHIATPASSSPHLPITRDTHLSIHMRRDRLRMTIRRPSAPSPARTGHTELIDHKPGALTSSFPSSADLAAAHPDHTTGTPASERISARRERLPMPHLREVAPAPARSNHTLATEHKPGALTTQHPSSVPFVGSQPGFIQAADHLPARPDAPLDPPATPQLPLHPPPALPPPPPFECEAEQ